MFYAQITLNDAAHAGALEAARNPTSFLAGTNCTTANQDSNRVMCRTLSESKGGFVTVAPADVTVQCSTSPCPASPALGNTVSVIVTGHFRLVTPIIGGLLGSDLQLHATSQAQLNAAPVVTTGAPVASFTAAPTLGPAPLAVTLTDTSTGSPTSWSWDFGDGQSSGVRGPHSHTYTTAGTYSVKLTVAGPGGSTFTTRTITVSTAPPAPPVALIGASPTSGAAPLTVVFSDASTGSPTTWAWAFGDSQTSNQQNPGPHTYASSGNFTVTLTVTNASGTSSTTQAISALASCAAPVAAFTVNPTTGTKNSTPFDVTDGSSNMGVAGCNSVWSWDFGDGAGSVLQEPPNHVYTKKGTYTIQLGVSNLGGSSTTTRQVNVTN